MCGVVTKLLYRFLSVLTEFPQNFLSFFPFERFSALHNNFFLASFEDEIFTELFNFTLIDDTTFEGRC